MGERKHQKYSLRNDTYVRCGETADVLPSGFYDVVDTGSSGFGLKPKDTVTDQLIRIHGTPADDLFEDIQQFMLLGDLYDSLSFVHKRGYMVHGPGGSGKTSIGMMLAHQFIETMEGVVVFTPDPSSFYHGVSIMRDIEPGRPSLYLIEEADRIINNTHCLSILDGGLSIQRAVFVAMTNFKGSLPKRTTNRPGRFARVVEVATLPLEFQVEFVTRLSQRNPDALLGKAAPREIVEAFKGVHMTVDHLREAFGAHVILGQSLEAIRTRFVEMSQDDESDEEEKVESSHEDSWWSPED